jgi:hypothetical protein
MSPLVALFFAVEQQEVNDGILWTLHPRRLNAAMILENRLLIIDEPAVRDFVESAFEPGALAQQAMSQELKARSSRLTHVKSTLALWLSKVLLQSMPMEPSTWRGYQSLTHRFSLVSGSNNRQRSFWLVISFN